MEELLTLSSILTDIVKYVEDETSKQDFIVEHIKNVTKNHVSKFKLPQGNDWFNVSRPMTETDLKGKVVVLDFFTYCCINCLHLIPHLRALEDNFSVSDGLVVIGVHSAKFENEKNSANIALALKRYNITHPVINDASGYMWDEFKISCWPTIVIIGPVGQALFVLVGEQCRDELFLYIQSTLNFYKTEISSHSLPLNCFNNFITSGVLKFPGKIARYDNILAISDSGNHRILVLDESGNIQFKIGGKSSGFQDGSFEEAKFNSPQGLAFYNQFEIYVADTENHAIRLISLSELKVLTVAGTGTQGSDYIGGKQGTLQDISSPWDLCFVPQVYVKQSASKLVQLPTSDPVNSEKYPPNAPLAPAFSLPPPIPPPIPPPFPQPISSITASITNTSNAFAENSIMQEDKDSVTHNILLIAMSGIHQIWALFLEDTLWWKGKRYQKNVCVAIAGNGKEENRNNKYPMMASFAQPSGLTYNSTLKAVLVADSESSSIRKLSLEDGSVSHLVGGDKNPGNLFSFGDLDGKGYNVKLQHPLGLTCSLNGNFLYICDTYNNKIKKVDFSSSECLSLHEEKNILNEPSGCVLNESENILLITDTNNNTVVMFDLDKKVFKNMIIKEEEADESNSNLSEWEIVTEVSNRDCLLILVLHLEPDDIHGSWKLVVSNSDLVCDKLKGQISSVPIELQLRIPPVDSPRIEVANVLFNVSFCKKEICLYKRYSLKLIIKRSQKGNDIARVKFQKNVS